VVSTSAELGQPGYHHALLGAVYRTAAAAQQASRSRQRPRRADRGVHARPPARLRPGPGRRRRADARPAARCPARPAARGPPYRPGYLAAPLRACGQPDATPPQKRAATPPGLAEPLTDCELEVLRLLAAGRSNQRIAHDLVVAPDTVKKACDPRPGQARHRQPDQGRRAVPAARPDPL